MATTDQNCEQWIFNHVQKTSRSWFFRIFKRVISREATEFFSQGFDGKAQSYDRLFVIW
jgi:hypothetical protein